MKIKLGNKIFDFSKVYLFFLPTLVLFLQWFSIAGINLSWLVYLMLLLFVIRSFYKWASSIECSLLVLVIMITPLLTGFLFGTFNSLLYFSILMGAIYMLSIICFKEEAYVTFEQGCLFSCFLFAGIGIFEIFTGIYIIKDDSIFHNMLSNGLHFPKVCFTNTNDISQYLAIVFPLTVHLLLEKKKTFLSAIGVIMCVIITFYAQSRMAMIAFIGTIGLSFVLLLFVQNKVSSALKILISFAIVFIGLCIYDYHTHMIGKIIDGFFRINASADYVTARSSLYINLINASVSNPIGAFGQSYLINDMPPHNLWLFILSDFGLIPTALFLFFYGRTFMVLFRKLRETADIYYALLISTMIFFLVTACISSTNEQRKVIWLFLGIITREYYAVKRSKRIDKNGGINESLISNNK